MTQAQILAFVHSPIGAWLVAYALLLTWNQATREGSPVDQWTAKNAPRLHGALLLLRGAAGYGPQIAMGIYKILAGSTAPPDWLVSMLPISSSLQTYKTPTLPERRA